MCLEGWVFLVPFFVAFLWQGSILIYFHVFSLIPPNLCIKAMPKPLERQAAISIHGTQCANIQQLTHEELFQQQLKMHIQKVFSNETTVALQ